MSALSTISLLGKKKHLLHPSTKNTMYIYTVSNYNHTYACKYCFFLWMW